MLSGLTEKSMEQKLATLIWVSVLPLFHFSQKREKEKNKKEQKKKKKKEREMTEDGGLTFLSISNATAVAMANLGNKILFSLIVLSLFFSLLHASRPIDPNVSGTLTFSGFILVWIRNDLIRFVVF